MSHESIANIWRNIATRYGTGESKLRGSTCKLGHKIFPPRPICPTCKCDATETCHLAGVGHVYSYTLLHDPTTAFLFQAPFYIALVRLADGPLISAQLTDLGDEKPEIGMQVEMITRILTGSGNEGIITYGYKFRPKLK